MHSALRLIERLAHADDLALRPFEPRSAAMRHLQRCLGFLLSESNEDDPALTAHIETMLIDLAVLALGAAGEQAELARPRGLRAARLREILAEINARTSPR